MSDHDPAELPPLPAEPGYDRHISMNLAGRIIALLHAHPANTNQLAQAWEQARTLLDEVAHSPEPPAGSTLREAQDMAEIMEQRAIRAEQTAEENRRIAMTVTNAPRASRKLPDAPKYSGKPEELRPFLAQLRLKLNGEPDHFATVQQQLGYAINRLEGSALDQLMPHIHDDRIDLPDFAAFRTILETAFGDPDRRRTAERRLLGLKQANRDFSSYFAEFQRYAADAQYDNATKRVFLRHGLSREMIEALQHRDEPEDFHQFVQLLQRVANKLKDTRQELGTRSNTSGSSSRPPAPRPQSTPSTQAPTPSTPAPAQNTANPNYHGPAPMDLSSGRRALTWEEKSRRLSQGLCLYCGGSGHMASVCPNKRRPLRAAVTELAPSPYVHAPVPVSVTPVSSVSSSSDSSVSGKE